MHYGILQNICMEIRDSERFAEAAHRGQEYSDGIEYIVHPVMAGELAHEMGYPFEVVDACFLHDVLEDTEITETELRERFDDIVVEAVLAVTYTESEKSEGVSKLEKAKSDPLGHVVKFCDASSNFASTVFFGPKNGKRAIDNLDKYGMYVQQLRVGLPSPDDIDAYIRGHADGTI